MREPELTLTFKLEQNFPQTPANTICSYNFHNYYPNKATPCSETLETG